MAYMGHLFYTSALSNGPLARYFARKFGIEYPHDIIPDRVIAGYKMQGYTAVNPLSMYAVECLDIREGTISKLGARDGEVRPEIVAGANVDSNDSRIHDHLDIIWNRFSTIESIAVFGHSDCAKVNAIIEDSRLQDEELAAALTSGRIPSRHKNEAVAKYLAIKSSGVLLGMNGVETAVNERRLDIIPAFTLFEDTQTRDDFRLVKRSVQVFNPTDGAIRSVDHVTDLEACRASFSEGVSRADAIRNLLERGKQNCLEAIRSGDVSKAGILAR